MKQLLVAQQGVCLGGRQRGVQGVHWEVRGGARRLSVHSVGSASLVWALCDQGQARFWAQSFKPGP